MSSEATVLLVRHGHTSSNDAGLHVPMSGWTDIALSPQGIEDACRVARYVATQARAAVVYTSPLRRAWSTAAIIRQACAVPLRVAEDLREINCGEADGLPLEEVQRRYAEHWRKNLEQRDPEFRWPGGERLRELRQRAVMVVKNTASAHPGEQVVAVTHAGVISQVMGFIHGASPAAWECFRPRNGSVTKLVVSGEKIQVVCFDELPGQADGDSSAPESSSPRSAA
jgi:probable phosphoglycerate mutase